MYTVDSRDRVVELRDVPQSSVGAPCPVVVASEHDLFVAYLVQHTPAGWDGTSVRVVAPDSMHEPAAMVRFDKFHATMFGPPNDEAFMGVTRLPRAGCIPTARSKSSIRPGCASLSG
jgi:hypothetical protein